MLFALALDSSSFCTLKFRKDDLNLFTGSWFQNGNVDMIGFIIVDADGAMLLRIISFKLDRTLI